MGHHLDMGGLSGAAAPAAGGLVDRGVMFPYERDFGLWHAWCSDCRDSHCQDGMAEEKQGVLRRSRLKVFSSPPPRAYSY